MKSVVSRNRRWILLTVVAVLIVIGVIVWRLSQPLFVSLGRFESAQVADIAACLERHGYQAGRDFYVSDGGNRIDVAATKRNEINLLLAQSDLSGIAIFDNVCDLTADYKTRLKILEALKAELRRMIRTKRGVSDFQISVPYVEGAETVTLVASAVITFDSGYAVTDSDVEELRRLIVGAFPGLEERHLTLTDQHSRPLGGANR